MKRNYKGRSKLRVLVDMKYDISGCERVFICCIKPDGSTVTFDAVVKDAENGIVFYDVKSESDFDQCGWWTVWPEIVFDDDRTACGRAVRIFVYEAGKI